MWNKALIRERLDAELRRCESELGSFFLQSDLSEGVAAEGAVEQASEDAWKNDEGIKGLLKGDAGAEIVEQLPLWMVARLAQTNSELAKALKPFLNKLKYDPVIQTGAWMNDLMGPLQTFFNSLVNGADDPQYRVSKLMPNASSKWPVIQVNAEKGMAVCWVMCVKLVSVGGGTSPDQVRWYIQVDMYVRGVADIKARLHGAASVQDLLAERGRMLSFAPPTKAWSLQCGDNDRGQFLTEKGAAFVQGEGGDPLENTVYAYTNGIQVFLLTKLNEWFKK